MASLSVLPSGIPKGKPKTTSHLHTVTQSLTTLHHMVYNMPQNSPAIEAKSRETKGTTAKQMLWGRQDSIAQAICTLH